MQFRNCTSFLLLALLGSPMVAAPPTEATPESLPNVPQDFPIDAFDTNPFEILLPEDVPEHLRPRAELRGAQVPYAARAKSLLIRLGAFSDSGSEPNSDEARPVDMAFETLGLGPSSDAARELLDVAAEFRTSYLDSLKQRRSLTVEEQHQLEVAAYREAGEKLGEWLRAREAEGWAIAPLLERLLNGSSSSLAMFSTAQSQEEFRLDVAQYEEGFRTGLQQELGWIPRRFQ